MSKTSRSFWLALATALALIASVDVAFAWSCHARSRIGEGWGYSPVLRIAREDARLQCQLHTPRALRCRIVRCWR